MQQNIEEKTVLELKMAGITKMEIENARKDKRTINLAITAYWQERSRVQKNIEDFCLGAKVQVIDLRDASTAGGDFVLRLLLLNDACEAAMALSEKLDTAGPDEKFYGYLYDGSALLVGTVMECYYDPEKEWGTVYFVNSDAFPGGRRKLIVSTKYPVPDYKTIVAFPSEKKLHKPYTIKELADRFQRKTEKTLLSGDEAEEHALEISMKNLSPESKQPKDGTDNAAEDGKTGTEE